jgi:hypothetical protein
MAANEKSKARLLEELKDEITQLFENTLDYAQIAVSVPEQYKVLRSKILRIGNNCIRNVEKNMAHYEVEFIPSSEEIIQVRQPKVIKK